MNLSKLNIKELAALIYETLKKNDIDAVLVGGACVSIYSKNRYQSIDLDFVTYSELVPIEKALSKLGFKRTGRCFSNPKCLFLIDFVNPPIAVGHQSIHKFKTLKTTSGSLKLLNPTDCVKDRLASFFHWNDEQALEQALLVSENCLIDLSDLKRWAKKEGFEKKMKLFLTKTRKVKKT
jgi:hypothetical protein